MNTAQLTEDALQCLVESALIGEELNTLFEQFCRNVEAAGLPLMRAQLGMSTLHPLIESVDLVWWRDSTMESNSREHNSVPEERWLRSPLYWMLTERIRELHQNLIDESVDEGRFPIFKEFKQYGATDYFASLVPFGPFEASAKSLDGALISWLTDAKNGFSCTDINTLRKAQSYLGLASKLSKRESTAHNIATAYLGKDAGQRVLKGQIRLGEVDRIPAVVWFSDLRGSTALAEKLSAADFLMVLNTYFTCTAGAILNNGGEVLSFIGDGVFAVFPISEKSSSAVSAQKAINACTDARLRLARTNILRSKDNDDMLDFGLGLHVGDLMYGNIGVPERLEFTVVGPVANEVSRLEGLTKKIGVPVLVSNAFADLLDLRWKYLGTFDAHGVDDGLRVFKPPPEILTS